MAEPDPATLQTALAQTERLGRLVTELLDLSRIDAGAHRLELSRVRRSSRSWPRWSAEAKVNAAGSGREVYFGRRSPAGAPSLGDRDRLKQVVLNLLDNAARHSPPGGTVRVIAPDRRRRLPLEVADEGPGIPPAEREQVFERFTRGERATGGGTGLGLAIARWVVHLHGGGTIAAVDPVGPSPGSLEARSVASGSPSPATGHTEKRPHDQPRQHVRTGRDRPSGERWTAATPPGQTGHPGQPGSPSRPASPGPVPADAPAGGRPAAPLATAARPSQSVPPRPPSLLAQRWPGPTGTAVRCSWAC